DGVGVESCEEVIRYELPSNQRRFLCGRLVAQNQIVKPGGRQQIGEHFVMVSEVDVLGEREAVAIEPAPVLETDYRGRIFYGQRAERKVKQSKEDGVYPNTKGKGEHDN